MIERPSNQWVLLTCALAALELGGLVTWTFDAEDQIRFKLTAKGREMNAGAVLEEAPVDPERLLLALQGDQDMITMRVLKALQGV